MNAFNSKSIAVVILNYNNFPDTVECIDAILGCENLSIVLVDNASTDTSAEKLEKRYGTAINFLRMKRNAGYAVGNNAGVKYAVEVLHAHYVCILNNDTIAQPQMFFELATCLDENENCCIVSPVILEWGQNDRIQSAGGSIKLHLGKTPLNHAGEVYEKRELVEKCDYVGGACIMFRARDAAVLGPLPQCYFLFFEETEWCLKAGRLGFDVLCCWKCSLLHKGSATISKQAGTGPYFMVRNSALFVRRNASPAQLAVFVCWKCASILAKCILKRNSCWWEFAATHQGLYGKVAKEYAHLTAA